MDPAMIFFLLLLLLPLYLLLSHKRPKGLPPGSLGLPIVGQSLSFLRAMRENTAEQWLQNRIDKYGPIWKMSLFGKPTVFLCGQAANKFIYTCDGTKLASQKPLSVRRICGDKNILELSGHEHKRVRGALVSFLKPEALRQYVGKMDERVRKHLEMHWHGKQKVSAMPLMKILTFNIMSSLIMGIEEGAKRDMLVGLFQQLIKGSLSVPINFPFTRFSRSLQASRKIRMILADLIRERRAAQKEQTAFPQQDLITTLLNLRNEDSSAALSDEEIVDNAITIMIAGHDTISVLLTTLIRHLANDQAVYAGIAQEQEDVAKSRASGELLTWDDLARMKYTWRVALECLRMFPPVFNSFRKVLEDLEYKGYLIPKGWQVTWAASMTHMDESLFPDPTKFDPNHFDTKIPPYSFVAFGGGARICPGYEFARLETLITIHHLVNRFTWKLRCPDISFSRDPMPTFKDGLEIEIVPKLSLKVN
ncbi:hypothetical protein POPTR_004G017800v4 [Populus trichocarpa]|uniref:Cytochrome P450 n=1 Tax=Populus trichocarpa TaxID=3694 RepID=B9H1D5_POPTR|nr:cytochrome P450 716B1 [Populus trichocarpa]KAI5590508.1 hypothetical protein BDE02_04G013100 [Populus trichocarpa]PNT39110.1 hypothetical protein POPTR_004G017800v4 [Populus trichocarpa]|eukprot:XP_002304921.1 cytochrome P450 716B1 [Populus trichocarpa]